jgi:putative sterol carrier protein
MGEIEGLKAFVQRKIKVNGDMVFFMSLTSLVL